MSIGMSLRATPRMEQKLEQRLSQEQRIMLQERLVSARLELLQALRGERYEPHGTCPRCNRKLTPAEIIRGFNRDPNDYTTCCSGCGCRFEPKLICFGELSRIELPFYCDCQTLSQLEGKQNLSPQELARQHPAIFRSAVVHHGGIKKAFAKIGIAYPFEEVTDWKNKIIPFLGRLPDTLIAEYADASVFSVRALRKKLGIARYKQSDFLSELEDAKA